MFVTDLRQAARYAVANPGWSSVAILILGLGIGVNSVMWSTVRGLVLAPLEEVFGDDRVVLQAIPGTDPAARGKLSAADLFDIREQSRTLRSLDAYAERDFSWTGTPQPERLHGAEVSEGFFGAIRGAIPLGRAFLPDEARNGRKAAVISDALWKDRFQADPKVLGQALRLDGVDYEIVGVAGRRTWFPSLSTKVWVLRGIEGGPKNRAVRNLTAIAIPPPGTALGQMNEELSAIAARAAADSPDTNAGWQFRAARPIDALISRTDQASTLVIFLITGAVLLIACSNVANLMLAKAIARRREVAVRAALGASPAALFRLAFAEGLVIALPAGIVALLLAAWTGNIVIGQFTLQSMPPDTLVGASVMAVTGALSVVCVLLVCAAPAIQAVRSNVAATLRSSGPSTSPSAVQRRIGRGLVIMQAACAVVLLTFTGVAARAISVFHKADPGFAREGIATVTASAPEPKGPSDIRRYHEDLLPRIAATAGVESAGALSSIPSVQDDGISAVVEVEGAAAKLQAERPFAQYFAATPRALETLGIPMLKGRAISEADSAQAPRIAVVNEEMASRFWPYDSALGKRFRLRRQWITVAGIYRNTRMADLRRAPEPQFIVPFAQNPVAAMSYVVRSKAPDAVIPALRRTLSSVDPEQAALYAALSADFYNDLRGTRTFLGLLVFFAALALVLTSAGLFGLISYTIRRRAQEVSVRVAIGASPSQVMGIVFSEGLQLALMGLGLGSAAAYGLVRMTEGLLLPISAVDYLIYAGVVAAMLGAASLACWIPARQAARMSPMTGLKVD